MKCSEGISTCGKKMEGEMDMWIHLGVFIIKKRSFKTNWCYYLTALEEKTTCL